MKLRTFVAVLLFSFFCVSSAAADDTYNSAPTFSPYYAGSVKAEVLNKALEELNYIRWLIGVPNNVTLNSDYTKKAQHGAVLLDAIDTLTHTPAKPSDMSQSFYELGYDATTHGNIASWWRTKNGEKFGDISLSKSIKMYMDDSDSNNISRVGHRVWLMDPKMKYTGFGISTRRGYSVTYVYEEFGDFHDWYEENMTEMTEEQLKEYTQWFKWPISDEFITWPASKHEHPLTYFNFETAWSVTLNSDVFDKPSSSSVNVHLERLSDKKAWNFGSSSSDGYFNINESTIIFRPNNISSYSNGEEWRVNVSGLKRKDGGAGTFNYTVKFTSALTGYELSEEEDKTTIETQRNNEDDKENDNENETATGTQENKNSSSGGGGCNSFEISSLICVFLILGIPRVKKISFERVGK
ncbi:MAG: CAP domain-containing protein [Synergistales bacterium]|nr:CAP domain-containing protein [Synergistales bacterium]MDY6401711.1 CAP domain-containing protein [Synergistales bacterium]MDY6404519.1 CAP domain-containing protein [Synergistales bacterium]MDY6410414.1 CAP domain-containing protein [Synergistales bacterium]MDY6413656.1 CAP domain-containing protein [Synergistales bacterium]